MVKCDMVLLGKFSNPIDVSFEEPGLNLALIIDLQCDKQLDTIQRILSQEKYPTLRNKAAVFIATNILVA